MLATGLVGFALVVWGPRRRIFTSGYKGNPTSWAVSIGFILLSCSAVAPLVIAKFPQPTLPGAIQVHPVNANPEARQGVEMVNENSTLKVATKGFGLSTDLTKDDVSAIEVCESITSFFSKNSCRFEQCEKQENLSKPECEKYLKK